MWIESDGQDELEVEGEASERQDRQLTWEALHSRIAKKGREAGFLESTRRQLGWLLTYIVFGGNGLK